MRAELELLGREFVSGDARVDPKLGARTCERCELQGLCRVSERAGGGELEWDEGEGESVNDAATGKVS